MLNFFDALLWNISVGAIIAGATVYGVKWMEYYTAATTLSWSFGLDVASGALSLVAAILLIINSCCL